MPCGDERQPPALNQRRTDDTRLVTAAEHDRLGIENVAREPDQSRRAGKALGCRQGCALIDSQDLAICPLKTEPIETKPGAATILILKSDLALNVKQNIIQFFA